MKETMMNDRSSAFSNILKAELCIMAVFYRYEAWMRNMKIK